MDALVIHSPGDLRVEKFPTPLVEHGQVRVRIRTGGICGSDLHHDQHGGFGAIRIQQPMVVGHCPAPYWPARPPRLQDATQVAPVRTNAASFVREVSRG